jgi:hypothetical protein
MGYGERRHVRTALAAAQRPCLFRRRPPPPTSSLPETKEEKVDKAPSKDAGRRSNAPTTMMDWAVDNTPFTPAERARIDERLNLFKAVIATTRTILVSECDKLEIVKFDVPHILRASSASRDDVPRFMSPSSSSSSAALNLCVKNLSVSVHSLRTKPRAKKKRSWWACA